MNTHNMYTILVLEAMKSNEGILLQCHFCMERASALLGDDIKKCMPFERTRFYHAFGKSFHKDTLKNKIE